MAKINTMNYQPVTAWNGTQDLLIVEQPDGTKVATPEQVKQYMNAFMDDEPTEGSEEAVKSGGVFNAIENSVSLKSATGNPIIITDAANANAEELSMTIEPIQSGSGDPSPTNVRPISGISEAVATRTGKNLIDESALIAAVLDPTTGQPSASTDVKITPMISIKSSATYLFAHQNAEPFHIFAYAADGTFIERTDIYYDDAVVTTGATWAYVRIQGAGSAWIYADPVLMQTVDITIQLGQTVYGGSVNFKTGEVTVTHVFVSGTISSLINLPYVPKYQQGDGRNKNLCDKLIYRYDLNSDPHFFFENNRLVTRAVDGSMEIQLCYEIATPTTLTLTPAELELLKGNNTITANGAEISLSYYPDNAIGVLARRVDTAREQIAGLTANTLSGINISAYSSADNQFTAPTDGYVRMELRNANQYFYLYVNNTTVLGGEGHQVANANDYMTIFVRKGMKLYYNGTVHTAVFYSLT